MLTEYASVEAEASTSVTYHSDLRVRSNLAGTYINADSTEVERFLPAIHEDANFLPKNRHYILFFVI